MPKLNHFYEETVSGDKYQVVEIKEDEIAIRNVSSNIVYKVGDKEFSLNYKLIKEK